MNEEKKEWGIAMESCSEFIKDTILLALGDPTFTYIEIGIGEGKTLARVCDYLKDEVVTDYKAAAIDIQDGWSFNFEAFYNNIKGHRENIEIDLSGSPEALKKYPDESINAIMIDGDHSLEAVKEDFREANRILKVGGIIMFHDSDSFSQGRDDFERQSNGIRVRQALEELNLLKENDRYVVLKDYQPKAEDLRGIFIIGKIK